MLARGMGNTEIQFYFNRQDRPVNSGRISQIRGGTYGPEVPVTPDGKLHEFLAGFTPAEAGVVVARQEQPLAERARQRFVRGDDGYWYLVDGETAEQECKQTFDIKKITPLIRAVAALANNRGGFIFFGVSNANFQVIGLPDSTFQDLDIAAMTDKIKKFLMPTPLFCKFTIQIDAFQVGVIHVEKHKLPPIMITRDGEGLEEGTILFRYSGQSRRIKFGDLYAMLNERDRSAHATLLSGAARLSRIGTDKALIVDTQEGKVDAGKAIITIDRDLADQLEFIREGEFEEREGAPTLRLVGDVRAVDATGQPRERIVGRALTSDMVLRAFLRRERVRSPMEYICLSAQVQRHWLPLYYFVRLSDCSIEEAIQVLERTPAVYKLSKKNALERLRGERKAYSPPAVQAQPIEREILQGQLEGIVDRHAPRILARAIQSLPDDFTDFVPLLEVLDEMHESSLEDTILRGAVYRAASRLDEIEQLNSR